MGIKETFGSYGIVRRSEVGPVSDSPHIKPMPLRGHFSPGASPERDPGDILFRKER
jgi:hypothetical protein